MPVSALERHVAWHAMCLDAPRTPGGTMARDNPHATCGLSCLFAMRSPACFTCVNVSIYLYV